MYVYRTKCVHFESTVHRHYQHKIIGTFVPITAESVQDNAVEATNYRDASTLNDVPTPTVPQMCIRVLTARASCAIASTKLSICLIEQSICETIRDACTVYLGVSVRIYRLR